MSSLVTQSLSEKPLVVLIADDSIIANSIKKIFTSNDVAILQVKPEDFQKVYFLDLIRTKTSLYKIIWISGFTANEKNAKNEKILSTLEEVHAHYQQQYQQIVPLVIITRMMSDFAHSEPIYSLLKEKISENTTLIQRMFAQLPTAQFLVGQDVLGENHELLFPFRFLVEGMSQKVVFDPESEVFFQTPQAFFEVFYPQLVKPHTAQVFVVKGKPKKTTFWVEKIRKYSAQYFDLSLEIIRISSASPPQPQPFLTQGIEATSSQEDLERFFDEKIRLLPTSLKKNNGGVSLREVIQKTIHQSTLSSSKSSFPLPGDDLQTPPPHPTLSSISRAPEESPPQLMDFLDEKNLENNLFLEKKINKTAINQSKNTNSSQNPPLFPEENIATEGETEVEKDLQKIFGEKRSSATEKRVLSKYQSKKKIIKKSKRKKTLFYGGVAVIGMGMGVGVLVVVFQMGVLFLKRDLFTFIQEYQQAENSLVLAEKSGVSDTWYSLLDGQVKYYSLILDESFFDSASPLLAMVAEVKELVQSSKASEKSVEALYQAVMGGGEATQNKIQDLTQNSQGLFEKLSQIQSKISLLKASDFSTEENEKVETFRKEIAEQRQKTAIYSQLNTFLPPFLGVQEKRVYAVLLQNNLELRPTGGFIQAVALVTFDNGLLIDTQIMNVYEIDDKLLSTVSPPEEIKKVLGEERWYLRDSNWDPDFPSTAENVTWFLKESLGVSVDGVIALDFTVIADILGVTGDLELPEYNEVLTQKNLLDRVEFHAKDDLSPDLQTGKNYNKLLLQRLFAQLQELPREKIALFTNVLRTSLDEKNLMISLPKKQEKSVLEELGWDGQIIHPDCPAQLSGEVCLRDTLYQVEANVGVNRVNAYIHRDIQHEIMVTPEKIQHERIITYQNNARSDTWPQGKYRTYIRFYTPATSKLDSVSLDGQPVDVQLVTQYQVKDNQVYGMLLEVPRGKETVLKVSYSEKNTWNTPQRGLETVSQETESKNKFSYVFFDQKQPGWINDTLKIRIRHNDELIPKIIAPQAEVVGNSIDFAVDRKGHSFVGVEFQTK